MFKALAEPVSHQHQQYVTSFRKKIYTKLHEVLLPNDQAHVTTYKRWFLYPEKRVKAAFLDNKFSDEAKYNRIVKAMEYVLAKVLLEAIVESRELARVYVERDESLSKLMSEYTSEMKQMEGVCNEN